jgi:hypothetical protein
MSNRDKVIIRNFFAVDVYRLLAILPFSLPVEAFSQSNAPIPPTPGQPE